MASLADFVLRQSGGASETDPDLALGGVMSTVGGGRILSQASSGVTMTGVTVDDAMGQAEGDGSLFFDFSGGSLRWTPPGGTAGSPVVVSGGDGAYAIQGGNDGGVLLVTIATASLPSSDQTNTVTISNEVNKIFDDVSKADSQAGNINYRGLYWENAHASESLLDVRYWIDTNTPGQDVIALADGDEAVDVALEIIANEETAPSGPSFIGPTDYAGGITVASPFLFGEFKGFWVRRTVPAGVTEAVINNAFRLGFRIFV
jgi:hypothetical protein